MVTGITIEPLTHRRNRTRRARTINHFAPWRGVGEDGGKGDGGMNGGKEGREQRRKREKEKLDGAKGTRRRARERQRALSAAIVDV